MSHQSKVSARSDRPNLGQKKKQAKELLKAIERLDASEAARFTWNLPRFRGKSARDVIREGVALCDAQHVIARESGFESWPKLTEYIHELELKPDGYIAAFEDAVRAIIRGEEQELRRLLNEHRELATMRSSRHHQSVLVHYLAANGVENEHQVSPVNAVAIAKILFDAGSDAVVDAQAGFYDGGDGSTPLVGLVTSSHPHESGVQASLVREFCAAGAKVDGIGNDGLPLLSALGFRYPKAAVALADCGARIDNLPAAAGLGRIQLVRDYLDPANEAVSVACNFPNPGNDGLLESTAPHPDETLQQALIFASMAGFKDVVQLLLDHGVDINEGPRCRITAIHETCYQGDAEMVRFLLQRGADPTRRDEYWNSTAVGWSQGGNHSQLVDELLQHDRVDFVDAVEQKKYTIVSRMLTADTSLANAPNGEGAVLRFAAFQGDIRLVQTLLKFGADATLTNSEGHSAIDYAEKGRHSSVVALLQGNGEIASNKKDP